MWLLVWMPGDSRSSLMAFLFSVEPSWPSTRRWFLQCAKTARQEEEPRPGMAQLLLKLGEEEGQDVSRTGWTGRPCSLGGAGWRSWRPMVQRDIVIPDIARVRQSKGSACRHAGKCSGSLAQKGGDNAQLCRGSCVCAILAGAGGCHPELMVMSPTCMRWSATARYC